MPSWRRRIIGIFTLGGSSIGLTFTLTEFGGDRLPVIWLIILAVFVVIYAVGLVAGVLILENDKRMSAIAFPFWAIQVPVISSPWISYGMFSGAQFNVLITAAPDIQFFWAAGSVFTFALFQDVPFAAGANIVAILVCIALVKDERPVIKVQPEPINDQLDRLASQLSQTADQ